MYFLSFIELVLPYLRVDHPGFLVEGEILQHVVFVGYPHSRRKTRKDGDNVRLGVLDHY